MNLSPAKLRQYRLSILIAIAGLLFLNILLASSWPAYHQMMASVNWPTTRGVITECQLKSGYVRVGFSSNQKEVAGYYADVRYSYTVNGKRFIGRQISFDHSLHSEGAARAEVEIYSIGKNVSVYYDSTAHAVAVLKPGIQREQQSTLSFGAALFLVFALLFCFLSYTVYRLNKELRNCNSMPDT